MAENANLKIYEQARSVPKEAIKEIRGGRLAGFSDINPMWRIKRLTEIFGPCGKGWYYEIADKQIETSGNEVAVFLTINLYVKYGDEWSKPIVGTGGSKMVAMEKSGAYFSDECFKMSLTDALSVAMKSLGIAADIYFAKDRTKYDEESGPSALPKAPAAKPAAKAAEIPPFDLNKAIKELDGIKDLERFKTFVKDVKTRLSAEDWEKFKPIGTRKQKELTNAAAKA